MARFVVLDAVLAGVLACAGFGCDPGSVDEGDPSQRTLPEAPPSGSPVALHGQLRVEGTELVNERGEVVQLRGPSSMWLNYEIDGFAESLAGLSWMRDHWNLSVIRAAMGVEPAGAYLSNPEGAKRKVRTIVENAIVAGVYVIIDWHDHNAHQHEDEALEFFTEMAMTYGEFPHVIYELYNEPERASWETEVKPYHDRVVAGIRSIDPDNLIVLGTPNWSQHVDEAAAAPVAGDNLLYALHFYACSHGSALRERAESALAQGAPLFVTEWGATHADGGLDGELCLDEARSWTVWMNERNISWTAWKLDNCTDASCYFGETMTLIHGGWSDRHLQGHGPFVRDSMLE